MRRNRRPVSGRAKKTWGNGVHSAPAGGVRRARSGMDAVRWQRQEGGGAGMTERTRARSPVEGAASGSPGLLQFHPPPGRLVLVAGRLVVLDQAFHGPSQTA